MDRGKGMHARLGATALDDGTMRMLNSHAEGAVQSAVALYA